MHTHHQHNHAPAATTLDRQPARLGPPAWREHSILDSTSASHKLPFLGSFRSLPSLHTQAPQPTNANHPQKVKNTPQHTQLTGNQRSHGGKMPGKTRETPGNKPRNRRADGGKQPGKIPGNARPPRPSSQYRPCRPFTPPPQKKFSRKHPTQVTQTLIPNRLHVTHTRSRPEALPTHTRSAPPQLVQRFTKRFPFHLRPVITPELRESSLRQKHAANFPANLTFHLVESPKMRSVPPCRSLTSESPNSRSECRP